METTTTARVIQKRRPRAPRLVLSTTDEIIEAAIPKDSGHCVWADALKAAVPEARGVSVDLATIRFTDPRKGCRYTYLTPRPVQVDLVNFDQGIKPQPMTVQLRNAMVTKSGQKKVKRVQGDNHPIPTAKTELSQAIGHDRVPDRIGGRTPPLAAYGNARGRRREFGIRGLGRPVLKTEQP